MKKFLVLIAASVLVSTVAMAQDKDAAIAIFKKASCTGCHAIKDQGVEKKKSDAKDDEKDEEKEAGEKKDPPDLSHVGKERNAEWIGSYLMKKEKIEGRAHKKKFKGTPEERTTLATWLGSLK